MYYYLTHAPINFFFKHSPRDFVVEEVPLYEFSGDGEHLILKVRKKELATWDMISKIANYLGINAREIGYAGLKDKHAMTTQYISVHKRYEEKVSTMNLEGIKVLETTYHNNKIKLGHLKENRFFVRLKKVTKADATKIEQAVKLIKAQGMPNYFGFQRFGNEGDNYKMGEAIASGEKKEKNKKLHRLYLNAYQSYLFNSWLDARFAKVQSIKSNEPQKYNGDFSTPLGIMEGDVALHYPYGRAFTVEDPKLDSKRLQSRDIVISGLLAGSRAIRAGGVPGEIETAFDKPTTAEGARRFAWVYPTEMEAHYKAEDAWMELHFTLPKGCYATVLLEQIAKQPLENLTQGIG